MNEAQSTFRDFGIKIQNNIKCLNNKCSKQLGIFGSFLSFGFGI